jgi:predicted phosphodiesterase
MSETIQTAHNFRLITRFGILLLTALLIGLLTSCQETNQAPHNDPDNSELVAASIEEGQIKSTPQSPVESEIVTPEIEWVEEITPQPSPAVDYFDSLYPASQTDYVIPLTVRHAGSDRAELFFELSEPSEGKLVYQSLLPDSTERGEIQLDPGETRHMIELEGLTPGNSYAAKLLLGNDEGGFSEPPFGTETWGKVEFKTIAAGAPLRVGVLGDASFGDQATQQLVELMVGYDLDFVIHTGDVVYEVDSSNLFESYLNKFFQPFKPLLLKGPVYTVLGNHDYDQTVMFQDAPFYDYAFPAFEDPAYEYPPERRGNQFYGLAFGDLQFLMLDSQAIYGAGGREVQDAWMKEQLADTHFRHTIPVFHVSPYSSSVVHPGDGGPVRLSWNYLFEAANVPLVLSGHFHHYERLSSNGITYIVTGGGSSTLYAQGGSLAESHIYVPRTHFVLLEIYPDRIELSAIAKEGETFDRATITLE